MTNEIPKPTKLDTILDMEHALERMLYCVKRLRRDMNGHTTIGGAQGTNPCSRNDTKPDG